MSAIVHHAPGDNVIWAPMLREDDAGNILGPGPQWALLQCPVQDIFFGGARGGGKTDAVLGMWLNYVHTWGHMKRAVRGIIFRKSYPDLEEIETRSRELFPATGGKYSGHKRLWTWPSGATFRIRYLEKTEDSEHYKGHSYCVMIFEELTDWASPAIVDTVLGSLRSARGLPCISRATGNPGGVGHNWVKARYIDPAPPMKPFFDAESQRWRVFIPSLLEDNVILRKNDPGYENTLKAATSGREDLYKAWRFGVWDIVPGGGFLDDIWHARRHVLEPFEIPRSWRIKRTFDWGSAKPFSVGWWAESDGSTCILANGRPRTFPPGTMFRINEWYGCKDGKVNEGLRMTSREIARGILQREQLMGIADRVCAGPADSSIFDKEDDHCIAEEMAKPWIVCQGCASVYSPANPKLACKCWGPAKSERVVHWTAANKSPGSRKQGGDKLRQMLAASLAWPMEEPGLFVFAMCRGWIGTVPIIPRDKIKFDDVDTKAEDHCYDETRYAITESRSELAEVEIEGL